jgi:hypothetical protein
VLILGCGTSMLKLQSNCKLLLFYPPSAVTWRYCGCSSDGKGSPRRLRQCEGVCTAGTLTCWERQKLPLWSARQILGAAAESVRQQPQPAELVGVTHACSADMPDCSLHCSSGEPPPSLISQSAAAEGSCQRLGRPLQR